MSLNTKDADTAGATGEPLALEADTAAGEKRPSLTAVDLDLEELSGSLLVEELPGVGTALFRPGPAAGSAPASAARTEATTRIAERGLPAEVLDAADPSDLAVTTIQRPPPPVFFAPPAPHADDVELTTLPGAFLSPVLSAFKVGLRRVSSMLPPAMSSVRSGLRRASSMLPPAMSSVRSGLRRASSMLPPVRWSPRWPGPIGGLVAAIAGLVGAALVVIGITTAAPRPGAKRPPPSTAAVILPPALAAASSARTPEPTASAVAGACTLSGPPLLVAPRAVVAAGVEVRALGADLAIGFAQSEHQAILVRLAPSSPVGESSLSIAESTKVRAKSPIKRVTPIPGKKGRLGLAIDVDRRGDPLRGRRTVPLDPPLQLGVAEGHIAWAPLHGGVSGTLWAIDGDEPVDAMRGARSESNLSEVAVAFRRADALWVGTAEATGGLATKGGLSRLQGLGQLGSPAIAIDEGVVLAAWADRPSAEAPWRLRWVRFKAGEAPGDPHTFAMPAGGKGEQAMSPGLAVVPGGRFLLVWTEGPASAHDVRALTLSSEGAPIGAPLNLSQESVNAGQGQAAVSAAGRGVVAFLKASPGGFQVVAAPIACPLQ